MTDGATTEEAVEAALRALHHRDRSAGEIDRKLELRGVPEDERRSALETLIRTGLVDDRRFAETRAANLAARGAGDAFIRHDLARAGVAGEVIDGAIGALEGERERAEAIVARRGGGAKTARYLAGKGFSDDVVHAVVARGDDEPLG